MKFYAQEARLRWYELLKAAIRTSNGYFQQLYSFSFRIFLVVAEELKKSIIIVPKSWYKVGCSKIPTRNLSRADDFYNLIFLFVNQPTETDQMQTGQVY